MSDPGSAHSPLQNRIVDGVTVSNVAVPESVDELSDLLRSVDDHEEVVIPWGGGTMMGMGNVPETADLALELTRLNQVVVYEPDDLTIAMQAGCRIGDLDAILAEHGQMLPFEVACPAEATVGGLYATGISGPRRFGHGSMRDLVIGISIMSPSGEIARGGGMVVKNVSGYDMMRLHYGSLGSLGVIVQLNFKVLPRPPAQRTVVIRFAEIGHAVAAALAVRESQLAPSAILMLDEGAAGNAGIQAAPWSVLMRAEGPAEAATQQTKRLRESALVGSIESEILEDEAAEALWTKTSASLAAAPEEWAINVRIGMPPSRAGEIVHTVEVVAVERSLRSAVSVDFGNGLLFARFDAARDHVADLRLAWDALRGIGSHASLLTAPPSVKQGNDVYGNEPEGIGLMRALKQQFDPRRTLNRGRFIGHL